MPNSTLTHTALGYARHARYKDSGVDWIGEIPVHWEVRRLKYVCEMLVSNVDKLSKPFEIPVRLCNYVDVYKNEQITDSIEFMSATATQSEIERFTLQIDDVLITKDSEDWLDIGVPAWVRHEAQDLVCGYHLAMLRPVEGTCGGYLNFSLKASPIKIQFNLRAVGVTRYGLPQDGITTARIPLPPLEEQQRIDTFLEEKTADIDRAIVQKEALIALLKEQLQAMVQTAVTRGLDPQAPMKDSGVEWIGEIPAHWEVRRMATIGKFSKGYGISKADLVEDCLPAILYGHIYTQYNYTIDEVYYCVPPHIAERSREIQSGMLLLAGSGESIEEIGKCVLYRGADKAYTGGDTIIFSAEGQCELFLAYLLNSSGFNWEKARISKGEIVVHIYASRLKALYLPLPPFEEQNRIADFLELKTTEIDQAILQKKSQILALQELRQSLIDAAVTGKIKL